MSTEYILKNKCLQRMNYSDWHNTSFDCSIKREYSKLVYSFYKRINGEQILHGCCSTFKNCYYWKNKKIL